MSLQEFNEVMVKVGSLKYRVSQLTNEIKLLRGDKKKAEVDLHEALDTALELHIGVVLIQQSENN